MEPKTPFVRLEDDGSIQAFELGRVKRMESLEYMDNPVASPDKVDILVPREILNELAVKPTKSKQKIIPGLEALVKQIDIQSAKKMDGTPSVKSPKPIRYYDTPKPEFVWNGTGEVPLLFRGRHFWREEPITLITQLTLERLKVFKLIAEAWEGPVSAVIACKFKYGEPDFSVENFMKDFPGRINMILQTYDISGMDMIEYPINKLRNIAWSAAKTPFVFLLDVDFVPSSNTFKNLANDSLLNFYFENAHQAPTQKLALIVPAFEAKKTIRSIHNKEHALDLLKKKMIFIWGGRHHAATNFDRWMNASTSYCTQPDLQDEFEPYVVVPWYAPQYDPRFLGYSKNKKSHIVELILAGYDWVVSHNTLVTHMPHPRNKRYQLAGREENAQNWIVGSLFNLFIILGLQ